MPESRRIILSLSTQVVIYAIVDKGDKVSQVGSKRLLTGA